VPVVTLPAGQTVDSPRSRAELARGFGSLAARNPSLRVVSFVSTGDRGFAARDGRTTFGLVFIPPGAGPRDDQSRTAAAVTTALRSAVPGAKVWVTGLPALTTGAGGKGPGVLTETLLGALGALVVLAFVFGSLLALVPLLSAGVSILTTFLIVLGMTTFTNVSFLTQYLIALIGEGLGRTGRLITSAALILFLAFAALGAGPQTDLKVFATALGAGILLDATVVRALLVPALMSLFGRWNWWLPGWLGRALFISPDRTPGQQPVTPVPPMAWPTSDGGRPRPGSGD
jgi:MMPL family